MLHPNVIILSQNDFVNFSNTCTPSMPRVSYVILLLGTSINNYLTPKSYALDMHNGHEKTITGNSRSVLTGQLHLLAS